MDNDRRVIEVWREDWGIDRLETQLRKLEIFDERPEAIHFQAEYALAARSMKPVARVRTNGGRSEQMDSSILRQKSKFGKQPSGIIEGIRDGKCSCRVSESVWCCRSSIPR